jgi:hypothetical protein
MSPYGATPTACAECHQPDADQTENPDHQGAAFQTGCADCHNTSDWQTANFDHGLSQFQLTGAHVAAACTQCHVNGQYTGTPEECIACHAADYASTTQPVHVDAGFSTSCSECHTTATWGGSSFDHASTGFLLSGAHLEPTCSQCHTEGPYSNTSSQCVSCHLADFNGAVNPNHSAQGYPNNCEMCHTPTEWSSAVFDHNQSSFALTGAHIGANCVSCHSTGIFDGLASDCASCHADDYSNTSDPNHALAAFGTSCNECHSTADWQTDFNHNSTGFPLTGAHVGPSCAQCHTGGPFAQTSDECVSCHTTDYDNAQEPAHAGQYPTTCADCHNTAAWDQAAFSHGQTGFPLTGAHMQANCAQCHAGGEFVGTESACFSCHETEYNDTDDPAHAQAGFNTSCELCHSTVNWEGAQYDHNQTGFPLTGAHAPLNCIQCHASGEYSGRSPECISCHQSDYNGVSDPNHAASGFPQACQTCHTTVSWADATYDHNLSSFQLTGAHQTANCSQCHVTGYTGTPDECVDCHIADYTGATNPDHNLPTFSHACESCHSTQTWDGASFDHSLSDFPLTGAHVSASCTQCHTGGQYNGLSTACVSCHQTDFNGTSNPDHGDAGFGTTCNSCHTTSNWNSNYNHSQTGFPLTGAHLGQSCNTCHTGGSYSNQSSECVTCHLADYNGATNPSHSGYPTTCQQCHSTTNWDGASFDHSLSDFPLTGAHVSASCTQCHTGGQYSGTPTDCFFCHQTDYNSALPDHNDGYPNSCTDCHTTQDWNSNFNHDTQYFPIYTGRHRNEWNLCNECHTTSGVFTTYSCIACHEHSNRNEVDGHHDDVQDYTYTPTSCYECHPNGRADLILPGGETPVASPQRNGGRKP